MAETSNMETDQGNEKVHPQKVNVVICPFDDEASYDDVYLDEVTTITELVASFSGVNLYPPCADGMLPTEYLLERLPNCHYALIKVPKLLSHVTGVLSQALQWQRDTHRMLIPIYTARQDCDSSYPEFLRNDPLYMTDTNFKYKLHSAITSSQGQLLKELYPLGDASKGLAMNYYTPTTYLLGDAFQEKYYAECQKKVDINPHIMYERVEKTIIVFPKNCTKFKIPKEDFKNEIEVKLVVEVHGQKRYITCPMFDVADDETVYLPRIEVPNIQTTLRNMSEHNALAIPGVAKLTDAQMKVQGDAFANETEALLVRYHKDKYLSVYYNEETDDLKTKVLTAIKEDGRATGPSKKRKYAQEERERPNSAYIEWDSEKHDQQKVEDFKSDLQDRGLTILEINPTKKDTHLPQGGKDQQLSTVFVWLEKGKFTRKQEFVTYNYLYYQDKHQFVQVVPILSDDSNIKHEYLKNINALKYCAAGTPGYEKFMEDAVDACTGKKPLAFPCGPLYHGLVWTTALNFLSNALTGMVGKIRKELKELEPACERSTTKITLFPKLILLVEKQCRDAGGSFSGLYGIKQVKLTDFTMEDYQTAGSRTFTSGIQHVSDNGEVFVASFLYVRAVTCLKEIRYSNAFPLSLHQIEEQAREFCRLFQVAHKRIEVLNKNCVLHYYDEDRYRDLTHGLLLNRVIADCIRKHSQQGN